MIFFNLKNLICLGVSCLSLIISLPASASQWVLVGKAQNGNSHYIDFDSLRGSGSVRRFWARAENESGIVRALTQYSVDCTTRRLGLLEGIAYDLDGSVNPDRSFETTDPIMHEVIPGTIAEAYANFICSRVKPNESATTPRNISISGSSLAGYPKASCGDPVPTDADTYQLFPVFVDYSPGTLKYVISNLCRDALQITRENGIRSIQVASFTSQSHASSFASFLKNRLGSGEVGQPNTIVR